MKRPQARRKRKKQPLLCAEKSVPHPMHKEDLIGTKFVKPTYASSTLVMLNVQNVRQTLRCVASEEARPHLVNHEGEPDTATKESTADKEDKGIAREHDEAVQNAVQPRPVHPPSLIGQAEKAVVAEVANLRSYQVDRPGAGDRENKADNKLLCQWQLEEAALRRHTLHVDDVLVRAPVLALRAVGGGGCVRSSLRLRRTTSGRRRFSFRLGRRLCFGLGGAPALGHTQRAAAQRRRRRRGGEHAVEVQTAEHGDERKNVQKDMIIIRYKTLKEEGKL